MNLPRIKRKEMVGVPQKNPCSCPDLTLQIVRYFIGSRGSGFPLSQGWDSWGREREGI